jgi:hypothetical protein
LTDVQRQTEHRTCRLIVTAGKASPKRAIRWPGKSQALVLAAVADDQQRQFLPHQVAERVAVSVGLPTARPDVAGFAVF